MKGLADIRKEYTKATLDSSSVDKNPLHQFEKWFQEAVATEIPEPTAMNLSTVTASGRPSSRIVLFPLIERH